MASTHRSRLSGIDRIVVLGIAVVSVLCAAPGVHLFALWLSPVPATLVSHGLAVAGLGIAFWQWRSRLAATV